MVSNFTRLIATACIWGMTPLIILAATDSAGRDLNAVILVAIVMFAAAFSTRAVWNNVAETAQTLAEKSKRTGSRRVSRLQGRVERRRAGRAAQPPVRRRREGAAGKPDPAARRAALIAGIKSGRAFADTAATN